MRAESLEFFKVLVNTPSPSGYEQKTAAVFRRYVSGFAEEVKTDVMGNVMGILNKEGNPRVMLAGHIDEIGFIIRYISDEGFLYFGSIGGHDPVIPAGQRVFVHTTKGAIPGVIGRKPIHLMEDDDRKKSPALHDMWVDIGAKDKAAAQELVQIGDPVTYADEFQTLQGDLAAARSFDNKMGAFVVAEALRLLAEGKPKAAVYAVGTVQEEVGLRGAHTSAYGIDPLVGIAVDATHSTDYPGVDKKRVGELLPGKGPAICRGANINPRVFQMLVQTAQEMQIPYQVEAAGGHSGTDAHAMQISRAGMATGLVSVPVRYMHTPCEVLALQDVENAARLLAGFVQKLDGTSEFIP